MRIIVVTANKYVNLLAGFSCQFNKYWSKEHKVDVLCYKKPSFNLPPNFSVRSLGADDRYWTNGLIEFFSSFDEDYFVLFLEDQFIVKPLKKNVFDLAIGLISSKKVDKVFLSEFQNKNTLDWGPYSEHFHIWKNSNDWKPKETSLTPTSLIPSIWTTHAFVKFLKKNSTPWHFETQKIEKNIYEKMKVLRGIPSISMCIDACFE